MSQGKEKAKINSSFTRQTTGFHGKSNGNANSPEVESRSKALLASDVDKVREDLLGDLFLIALGGREDSVLEELVPLGERDRLFPLAVLVVKHDCESSEFQQFMLSQTSRERQGVKVGELNGRKREEERNEKPQRWAGSAG